MSEVLRPDYVRQLRKEWRVETGGNAMRLAQQAQRAKVKRLVLAIRKHKNNECTHCRVKLTHYYLADELDALSGQWLCEKHSSSLVKHRTFREAKDSEQAEWSFAFWMRVKGFVGSGSLWTA